MGGRGSETTGNDRWRGARWVRHAMLAGAALGGVLLAGTASSAPAEPANRLDAFPVAGACAYSDTFGLAWSRNGRPSRHDGIDIMAPRGTRTVAALAGRVTKLYRSEAGGNVLVLTAANGTYLVYVHLDRYAPGVTVGSRVAAGQLVAYVGQTGDAQKSGPHLHFEVHPGGGGAVDAYASLLAADGGRCQRAPFGVRSASRVRLGTPRP